MPRAARMTAGLRGSLAVLALMAALAAPALAAQAPAIPGPVTSGAATQGPATLAPAAPSPALQGPAARASEQTVEQTAPSVAVQADSDRAAAIRAEERLIDDHARAVDNAVEGGMPQLRFGEPLMISQVVWLFIIFGLFVFLCSHFLLPPVREVIEDRRARIGGDLEAARAARDEADAAAEAHRAATARARAEAAASLAAATQSANAEAAERASALNSRLDQQVKLAEARIAGARDTAMGALREAATDAAGALVERLSGLRDPAAVGAAVDRQLAARGHA